MINEVTLVGNLGQDPEIKNFDNGSKVATFSVATSDGYKDKDTNEWINTTEWHRIVVWNKMAESVEKNLRKGRMVFLKGKIVTRKYQDKNDETKQVTEIRASFVRSLEKRERSSVPTEVPGDVAAAAVESESGETMPF